jgi:hypothetical protein
MISRDRCVAGVSKKSKLYKRYPHYVSALYMSRGPTIVRIPNRLVRFGSSHNWIFLARFSQRSVPLRIDIPKYIDNPYPILDHIYTGISVNTGYPDVLKEAHVSSKLLRNEILALKILVKRLGGKFIQSPRIRDVLFGSFNKSPGEWVSNNAAL